MRRRRRERGTCCVIAKSPRKVTGLTHGCWGVHSRARPAPQQQGGPGPPPGMTPHQPTSPPSHKGAGQWRMFPTQTPCCCKPPAPPAQSAALKHGQVAPSPGKCPGKKGMGSRGSHRDPHHLFPGSLRSNHPQPWLSSHSPLGSVSWTPRSSLARSWAWAPSAPESASSPEALLMPARPVGCIPEGCGVSGMGGAWCERCWVWSWCWRGEERAESKGCARTAAGQVRGKRQPWASQQRGLGVEGQGTHPGHPQECSGGHHVPPTDPSHPGLDGGPCLYPEHCAAAVSSE